MGLSRREAPLRVVHVISGDLWAGAEVMAWHLLTHLAEQGDCVVTAICLNDGVLADRLRRNGIDVRILREDTLSLTEIVRGAAKLLRGTQVHILHSHRYKEHVIAALLAQFFGSRLIATVHGLPEPTPTGRVRDAVRTWSTHRLLRHRFDRVAAVSNVMKETLVNEHGFRRGVVDVVHNGVTIPKERALRPCSNGVHHIGSVGRLVPVKNFALFLETAAVLRQSFSNLTFSLLGNGPDRDALLGMAHALDLDGCFRIVEPTPDPSAYYQSLDVYVNTSHAEGLPLSILEAMAFGTPVVASAVGGIPEIVRHGVNGLLVREPQPAAFAAACARVLTNATLRERFRTESKAAVATCFSAAAMAGRYVDLYRQLAMPARLSVA